MLYKIAHILRDKLGWLWNFIEYMNGILFSLKYGKKLKRIALNEVPAGYVVQPIRTMPTEKLVAFFQHQPKESFAFFHPHGFDAGSIKVIQRNKAFLGYVLIDSTNEGRMVDIDYRGKGLGTAMNKILNEVGFGIGLRLFESVSKDNVASYKSALSASNVKVVKELPHNELYLEILPE